MHANAALSLTQNRQSPAKEGADLQGGADITDGRAGLVNPTY